MSICQCLRVVERSCKSQFIWRGTARVPAAVYEFLLRDMAIRPLIDGVTELDPDEPAVPVTGLAFLCQQFVLLLRQRSIDNEAAAIGLEEATEKLCARVKSSDDKTVRAFLARLSFFLLYSPHTYMRTRTAADICATSANAGPPPFIRRD